MNPTPKTTSSNKRKADDAPPSAGSNVFEEESRPPGIKAMKAKRNKGKGKVGPAFATDDNIWEKKEKDMAQREKLQKMSVYKTLLARSESLDEDEKVLKKKLMVQEDMGLDSMALKRRLIAVTLEAHSPVCGPLVM
ncbi:hypothetical protein ARALYDRAFT_355813 [Arabidopsis lyrata subsp. lyrata]|uniref:No apical meristem-associated C-terminal domain-containing protein n=1 Tax=Arabidopsis lyrata subsp. lyrata TaxID=81972 RepID=D7MIT0_ARALL|nr:hypothetical protein ARALYDRAFT_355813 [Arabidopsis lyrata subsp. lyrata]